MSVKLVILGMLRRGALHGYELKNSIEQEMGDWTSIAFGSIYFALKKLSEEDCVRQSGQEQHGNRPSRIIYEITKKGNDEFLRLLSALWQERSRTYFPFDIALYFMNELPVEERMNAISDRIRQGEIALKYLKEHRAEEMADPQVPPVADVIFTHSLCHLEAELSWLKKLSVKMANGAFD